MEAIGDPENMLEALRKVIAKQGAAGVDGMTVRELERYGQRHAAEIRLGRYRLLPSWHAMRIQP
jgi:hypothetical protein